MIIDNKPANEAVLSNVGEVGEFRIRNSAKAFNILSSGLYANKIRAIIRELSCNAVDSHTAAGKSGTPFDVHLPNTLEPHFSIRDYGTGLSHDQVTNIYTTYFESTKTDSNDFIGALGLGSKSPFSYTDNFTVTAIKDGRKGIYTAFINEQGVPSIALMMEEATNEPSGVEIKFAVEDRWDFDKFRSEARTVYTYFALRPVVSGCDFEFRDVTYTDKDIVPGVHSVDSRRSTAVMGNIAYPIEVPNDNANLGALASLLNCGLEMHFAIGELDFQASREGLSYVPQTINAIKAKLESVNACLATKIADEANAIANEWERAEFCLKKADSQLWQAAVIKYVTDTKFSLIQNPSGNYLRPAIFEFDVDDLSKKYNLTIMGFTKGANSPTCHLLKSTTRHVNNPTGTRVTETVWEMSVNSRAFFVTNNTKIGATERAKYHWRKQMPQVDGVTRNGYRDHYVYVLSAADNTKPAKFAEFFKALHNPLADRIIPVDSLLKKERATGPSGLGKDVTIMALQERNQGGYYRSKEMVWRDAGKADSFDATKTYYYLPLSGYNVISNGVDISNVKSFYDNIISSGLPGLGDITIYGVRKTDHAWVVKQKNWVNIQDHLKAVLAKVDDKFFNKFVAKEIDVRGVFKYNESIVKNVADQNSVYVQFVSQFKNLPEAKFSRHSLETLCRQYAKAIDFSAMIVSVQAEWTKVRERYALLSNLKDYDLNSQAVAEYINLIDMKEVK